MRIDGKNIYLRTTTEDDLNKFSEWETKKSVTEFFTISDGRDLDEISVEYFERLNDETKLQLTICLKESEEAIGRIYISGIDSHYDSMDITRIYIGRDDLRGKGLGEDALRTVLKLGFEMMGLERITLDHFTDNIRAKNLYLKVGFTPEGCMRHSGKKNGEYVDLNLMSILKNEYYAAM